MIDMPAPVNTAIRRHSCRVSVLFLLVLSALLGCQTLPDTGEASVPDAEPVVLQPLPEPAVAQERADRHRQRIADWLYQGLRALREDHLMVPPDDSAHAWFRRVLALEPDNELALQGLQDIAARYVELAELSSRQGQFDSAEQFLRRAALVDPDHPRIEAGRETLALERDRTRHVQMLDPDTLRRRDETALRNGLSEVLELLAASPDTLYLVITAPSDELGRWVYGEMRDALGVRRVPGGIEIGARPSVRLLTRG